MPLYFYRPAKTPCRLCGQGFERWEKAGDPRLTECEKCGQAVSAQLPVSVHTPKQTRKPSVSEAKNAGFTVLKRISSGEYEKQ
jgi:hypothetical protein